MGPAGTAKAKTNPARIAAALLLFAVVVLLAWGALYQQPRPDPFRTPGLLDWLLTPEPHRAYGVMPVVPVGSELGLVPRGLCAKPHECGWLEIGADGSAVFIDADGLVRVAAKLHWSPSSGQLFVLASSGELFTLALAGGRGMKWRQLELPGPPRTIHVVGSSPAGTVWAVGSSGYAALSSDGRQWAHVATDTDRDLIALAPGDTEAFVIRSDNILIKLRPDDGAGYGSPEDLRQTRQREPTSIKRLTSRDRLGAPYVLSPIKAIGGKRLQAVTFKNERTIWITGDDGLILHTEDGGQSWTKLHEQAGLSLTNLYIESTGVGWAVGRDGDGRQVAVAADKAEVAQGADDGWRMLPHYLAPWCFFLGIPGLLLAGFVNLHVWRRDPDSPQDSIKERAIPISDALNC